MMRGLFAALSLKGASILHGLSPWLILGEQ